MSRVGRGLAVGTGPRERQVVLNGSLSRGPWPQLGAVLTHPMLRAFLNGSVACCVPSHV